MGCVVFLHAIISKMSVIFIVTFPNWAWLAGETLCIRDQNVGQRAEQNACFYFSRLARCDLYEER